MSLYDAGIYAFAALLGAAVFYVSRKVSARRRLRMGIVLFVVGWAGLLLAHGLSDLPVFQSEVLVYAWIGLCAAAGIVIAPLFLVTATFDWLGPTRPRHQRRQFPPFR